MSPPSQPSLRKSLHSKRAVGTLLYIEVGVCPIFSLNGLERAFGLDVLTASRPYVHRVFAAIDNRRLVRANLGGALFTRPTVSSAFVECVREICIQRPRIVVVDSVE